jgi:hypothetical protein
MDMIDARNKMDCGIFPAHSSPIVVPQKISEAMEKPVPAKK